MVPGALDALLEPGLFRALGDPTRVLLLRCLAKCARPCSVSEIAECCDVDMSVVSRHLRVLAGAGVVHAEKRGREVLYAARYDHVAGLLRALAKAFESCGLGDGCAGGSCPPGVCAPIRSKGVRRGT